MVPGVLPDTVVDGKSIIMAGDVCSEYSWNQTSGIKDKRDLVSKENILGSKPNELFIILHH